MENRFPNLSFTYLLISRHLNVADSTAPATVERNATNFS